MPPTPSDIAWAAGVIEGEGWIGTPKKRFIPTVQVIMTDADVVGRLYGIFAVGLVRYKASREDRHTDTWRWTVTKRADTLSVCAAVRPYMGKRRTEQIDALLAQYPLVDVVAAIDTAARQAVESRHENAISVISPLAGLLQRGESS